MPDRTAQIVLALANQASPGLRQTATDAQALSAALSREALVAGDLNKALLLMDQALGQTSATGQAAATIALQQATAEARLSIALGDRRRAIEQLEGAITQENAQTLQGVRAATLLTQIENQEAQAAQRAADSELSLARARAQAAASGGNRTGAAGILQSAIGSAGGASEQAVLQTQSQLNRLLGEGGGLAEQFGGAFKSSLLGIVGPAAIVAGSLAALKGAADLTVAGENVNRVGRSFESLARQAGTTGDVLLGALRKASGGEISDLNLELATDKGLLLGVANNAQQFADIMTIARDRAAKMGITTTQAFDDITTGIGRESPRILDNLGIIVDADKAHQAYAQSIGKSTDELTKAERIEALRNAVIAQGKGTLDAQTTAINDQTNSYARLGVALENAKNKTGSFLSTQTQGTAGDLATAISGIFSGTVEGSAEAAVAIDNLTRRLQGIPQLTAAQQQAQEGWTRSIFEWIAAREVQLGLLAATPPPSSGGGGSFDFAPPIDATNAQLAYANALELTGVRARAAALAADQKSQSDKVASIDARAHAIAEQQLSTQAENAARAMLATGPVGARTAALLAGSSGQVDVLTAAYYRLFAAQQAAASVDPLKGVSEGRSERDTPGDRAEGLAAGRAAQASAEQARLQQLIATGTETQKITALQQQYNQAVKQFGKNSKEAIDAQTNIIRAQQAAAKAGGKGRVSAAESTALSLASIERNSGDQQLRILRENQERLRDAQLDFDIKRSRSAEDFQEDYQKLLNKGQRVQAAALKEDFEKKQRRDQEDFDREKRRTLRNNQEALGDQSDKVDNQVTNVNARAAARGVRTNGARTSGTVPPVVSPAAADGGTTPAQRVIQILLQLRVELDNKLVGKLLYDGGLHEQIDADLALAIAGITPGSGQPAVAGVG